MAGVSGWLLLATPVNQPFAVSPDMITSTGETPMLLARPRYSQHFIPRL